MGKSHNCWVYQQFCWVHVATPFNALGNTQHLGHSKFLQKQQHLKLEGRDFLQSNLSKFTYWLWLLDQFDDVAPNELHKQFDKATDPTICSISDSISPTDWAKPSLITLGSKLTLDFKER